MMLLVALMGISVATAQTGTLTGVVVDQNKDPLTGASVVVSGTDKGTMTDIDGNFTLSSLTDGAKIVVSFIGYDSKTITYNGQKNVEIVLNENATMLDEVIAVAYGTQKKSTFTGAATTVKGNDIEKVHGTGFAEALQGMSAGVGVSTPAGNPGADTRIQIRGISSMSGKSDPLIIVDGMPYDGNLTQINQSDIENLSVLKDAAATSLYGSRAANGVIMITTKKGKTGNATVNVRAGWGTSDNAVKNPNKSNPYQQLENRWYAYFYDGYYEDGMSMQEAGDYASSMAQEQMRKTTDSKGNPIYVSPFKYIDAPYVLHDGQGNPYMNPDTEIIWDREDWDPYVAGFSRKLRQEYSVDVSGSLAAGNTDYFFSGSYLDDGGYAMNQYYKRYTFRANVNTNIRDWWRAGGSVSYSSSRQNVSGASRAMNYYTSLSGLYLRNEDNTDWVYSEKTGRRMYNYNKYTGNFFGISPLNNGGDYWDNPNDESFNNNMGSIVTSNFYTEFKLPFNLKFRSALNIDNYNSRSMSYDSAVHGGDQLAPYGVTVKTNGGYAERYNYNQRSTTWNNVLSGEWKIGDRHTINALLGQEWYQWDSHYEQGWGSGIMELGKYELSNTTKEFGVWGGRDSYALLSYFARAEYNYDQKYYASLSFREDGSSRFNPKKRWGSFWSAGASWRISKENFFSQDSFINNLSVRASYGTTGNDKLVKRKDNGLDDGELLYAYQATYGADDLYLTSGLKPLTLAANDLRWEKNEQWNIGIDFSAWNFLNGSIEYYSRTSRDLLYYMQIPSSAQVGGITGYNTNLGDLRNSGLELTLSAKIYSDKDWFITIDGNLSTLKNEVTRLATDPFNFAGVACTYRMEEGSSLFDFIAPQYDGLNPETGKPGWLIRDGNGGWKRTENTAAVTTADYVKVGSAIPGLFGSITPTVQYKGLDLSAMFYYSYGSYMSDYTYKERTLNSPGIGMDWDLIQNRWRKPGDNNPTMYGRWSARTNGNAKYSTAWVFKNDYWRVRNITIGYTLPKNITRKATIENLRVYFSATNPFTWGAAKDRKTDPETGISGNTYNGNDDYDNGVQGSRRIFMGGIQLTF